MKPFPLRPRITVPSLLARKNIFLKASEGKPSGHKRHEKIVAITAYDYTFARLVDAAGIDLILVGDSLGCVIQGHPTTLPVTLDEMIYHCRCVSRGATRALVVGDLPFMSYQVSIEQGIESAGRLVKEGGVAAVKLEGGVAMAPLIRRLTDIDVPVVGHVGLTPQSFHRMGGHRQQGRQSSTAGTRPAGSRERVFDDALAVADAGAFALVLEGMPPDLAKTISEHVSIPTIGIACGAHCDGQILVVNDMLGLDPDFKPRFAKRFAEVGEEIRAAVGRYIAEVTEGSFPAEENALKLEAAR